MENQEILDYELDEKLIEDEERFLQLTQKIKSRCLLANIECSDKEDEYSGKYLLLKIPAGREKRDLIIQDCKEAESLLEINFEDYIFLNKYSAICSYKLGTIETAIETINRMPTTFIYQRLLGKRIDIPNNLDSDSKIEISQTFDASTVKIEIGYPSNECQTLLSNMNHRRATLISLKISGISVSTHDKAIIILEKISNAVFFQIDLAKNLSLSLSREIKIRRIPVTGTRRNNALELKFPDTQYDIEPLSLYWYAKSALGMPLLQFLAFYQTIEFYFPVYCEIEAKRAIKNILKDPTFNQFSDSDLAKIINMVKTKIGKGYDAEKTLLKATLYECINYDQIRSFLAENEDAREFFSTEKCKELSKYKIKAEQNDIDLLNNLVERIYDIRCKVVHTKGDNNTEVELLLPFSKEADVLYYDIELIKRISQQVIIAGGSPLSF